MEQPAANLLHLALGQRHGKPIEKGVGKPMETGAPPPVKLSSIMASLKTTTLTVTPVGSFEEHKEEGKEDGEGTGHGQAVVIELGQMHT